MICHEGKVLNIERVPSYKVTRKLVHMDLNGAIPIGLRVAFAPTVDALIRFHFDEQPVFTAAGVDEECLNVCDFHFYFLLIQRFARCLPGRVDILKLLIRQTL